MARGPVDPEITIEDLVRGRPNPAAALCRFGIVCIQRGEPVWDTLREAAEEKGIRDLSEVLAELENGRAT